MTSEIIFKNECFGRLGWWSGKRGVCHPNNTKNGSCSPSTLTLTTGLTGSRKPADYVEEVQTRLRGEAVLEADSREQAQGNFDYYLDREVY